MIARVAGAAGIDKGAHDRALSRKWTGAGLLL